MSNLFKKVAVFTDLHLGLNANSATHNQDCEDFIDWFIKTAKENGCEIGMFLGDFHHSRSTMNIVTMDYSIRCLEKLGKSFDNFFLLVGNHDMYHKHARDIHSTIYGNHINGITIVDKPITIDEVTLCPWLVGDEWKKIKSQSGRYLFGHFEIPGFFLNAMILMPDNNELQLNHIKKYELGFSGHFHKRQHTKNMHYIGNAFPHNFADANDTERGMMILEWGKEPEFISWHNQPLFITNKLSYILEHTELLKEKMHCKLSLDIPLSFDEANFIKETFIPEYKLRELSLVPERIDVNVNNSEFVDLDFESIDKIILNQITTLDTKAFDKSILLDIYTNL
jgi:DNA repair exonuclease SbcCD nuclease subunit